MRELLNRILESVKAFHSRLDRNRKILLYVGLSVLILALTFGILFFTRTEYVVVAQGLTAADAQIVTGQLDELGIPWQDSMNTSVISVPEAYASRARMEIAANVQAVSFSWSDFFSSESITMTSQTREQMIIQATASGVEESIETLTSVDNATVILQIPKESNYFVKDEIESKASVVLELKGGTSLNEQQINGIVSLIINSVKDLTAENVALLDSNGIQLNDPYRMDDFSANSNYELQYKVQQQMQHDLTSFLETLYGVGNVEVKPSVIMEFDRQTESQRIFSPPIEGEISGMVRSATTITENVVNSAGAVGVPGTDSNSGEATGYVEGDSGESSYEKASETLNYELNEIYREIISSQGDIKELSIGVLLNSTALIDGQLSNDHYTELVSLIAMSAGTAADNISVMVSEFPDPMAYYDVYTAEVEDGLVFGVPLWALIVVAVVTLIVVIVVVLMIRRKKAKEAEAAELEAQRKKELEAKRDLDEIDQIEEDKGSPKYHIEKFVDNNPEAAAALLRAWLND
ncbi:flagellar basal-body MS-ring/collar protein FliF [Fusibacter tunisiensis]|uniref:Flagellar M-ring protein n=1 Tax=Fusibacter tunisiensis TaxID=1008308 RepID=A0ABS2MME4_9FIRM|nr:flagellar basal-body MS-ring/collar protein FliF [Fusibacter tunisiensis]MBM7560580.1 flagellar M-ring protein FliF [Fusibacter tunisiensis]